MSHQKLCRCVDGHWTALVWAFLQDLVKDEDREKLIKNQYDHLNQCFRQSDDHIPPVSIGGSLLQWWQHPHVYVFFSQVQNLLGEWKGMQNAPDKLTVWDTGGWDYLCWRVDSLPYHN